MSSGRPLASARMPFWIAVAAFAPAPSNTSGALPFAASTAPVSVAIVRRSAS